MGITISSDDWYAIRVKSNRERITAVGLMGKGFDVFLPEYVRPRRANGGVERVVLFPGYVFGRFDPHNRLPILTLPGVIHIVCIGKTPAPVDAMELKSLQVLLQTGLPINPNEHYIVGERVNIDNGPLAGASGVIAGEDNRRLLVSITLLQRSLSVALPREWICKATAPHGGGIFAPQGSAYDR
jgi:transcription antitermination factor NusG